MPKNLVPINYGPPPPAKEPVATTMLRVLNVLLLLSGCALSCGSGFAFDAPGSEDHVATWVFVVTALALPVTCIAALLISTSLARKGNHKGAQFVLLLPLVDVLIFAINVVWMKFRRGGRF